MLGLAIIGAVLFGAGAFSTLLPLGLAQSVEARSPSGIVARLEKASSYTVSVAARRVTWNPGRPLGRGQGMPGPGSATYTRTPDGGVTLEMRRPDGTTDVTTGPVPEVAVNGSVPRIMRSLGRVVLGMGAVFAIGYVATPTDVAGRIAAGCWGGFAAYLVGTVVLRRQVAAARDRPKAQRPKALITRVELVSYNIPGVLLLVLLLLFLDERIGPVAFAITAVLCGATVVVLGFRMLARTRARLSVRQTAPD